jgi:cytochrome c peroxidase
VAEDNGRFRAPTLRNITVSAPYMHDGSIDTLPEVLDFYAHGGRTLVEGEDEGDGKQNKLKSRFIKGFDMSAQDKTDLLAFLDSLTDKQFLTDSRHAMPLIAESD